ncbi:hypothetical protein CGLO_11660 [Colletotrichum gloeosporioides Cg-14]|uniref:Uncharacterized protein n=1 Tax=Colletotrichum gloeosporioides (strain Cg-14) TaxID=1237896 RepID=T0KAJ5_COLGC|nr:hypothetical protein CGLO_11660 [Colletotrichum gloeosporioides Cg-14]
MNGRQATIQRHMIRMRHINNLSLLPHMLDLPSAIHQ